MEHVGTMGPERRRVNAIPCPEPLRQFAEEAVNAGRAAALSGHCSSKIPALNDVHPEHFALSIATVDGTELTIADTADTFSLQSITKLFALSALLQADPDAWEQVGWAHSEAGFASVTELDIRGGMPRNPFVNAGALIVTDRLLTLTGDVPTAIARLIAGRGPNAITPLVDERVAESEAATDHRNQAIAHLLAEHCRLQNPVDHVLDQYFRQCALSASTLTVARGALILAERDSPTAALPIETARRINAVLLTAGMYGAAGDIAHRIGLPAKSGIGGGMVAVMPGEGTICAWSPPLDENGNSVGAIRAIEVFATRAGWSVF